MLEGIPVVPRGIPGLLKNVWESFSPLNFQKVEIRRVGGDERRAAPLLSSVEC